MKDVFEIICTILGAILLMAVVFLLAGWIGLLLWNWIAVGVFGAPTLTFWQMYGLIWLIRILVPSATVNKKEK